MDELEELQKLRRLKELEEQAKGPDPSVLQKVLEFVKTGAQDVGRGAANTVAKIPSTVADVFGGLLPAEGWANMKKTTEQGEEKVRQALPIDPNESTARKYARVGLESIGGGAALNPASMLKAPITAGLANAAGGMGAQAGFDWAGGEKNPQMAAIASLLGGLVGGVGTTYGLSKLPGNNLSLSRGERRLSDATRELTPEQWQEVNGNTSLLNSSGSRTATLADAFPRNSSVMGVAEEVRGSKGGEAFTARTNGREGDIRAITQAAMDKVGPPVDPNTVANRLSDSANGAIENLEGLRSTGIRNRLMNQPVRASDVAGIYRDLLSKAESTSNASEAAAYKAVANQLVDQSGKKFVTDTQALSLAIKELKENPPGPSASTGRAISSKALSQAVKDAEAGLSNISPAFKGAMDEFKAFTETAVNPMKEGPIGRLADRNPLTAGPTPVGRINNLVTGNSPEVISQTLKTLTDPKLTNQQSIGREAIARALLEQKLGKSPTNPAEILRGGDENSLAAQQLNAVLGDKAPGFNSAMKTTDLLQNFMNAPGHRGAEMPSPLAAAAQPSWFGKMAAVVSGERGANEQIAKLLMSPTKENLAKLQELAQFDPNIRRMLMLNSIAAAQMPERK